MDYTQYSKIQLKEMLSVFLESAEIRDFKELKNDYFLENMDKKPHNHAFRLIQYYMKQFGKEELKNSFLELESSLLNRKKYTFLNMNLEPRFRSEYTEQIIENRQNAFDLYKKEPEFFHLQMEFEPNNEFDGNAIVVYAEGKKERVYIGYISRSFNIRIGKLLAEDEFPFIQTNYQDIIEGNYSVDNIIIDVYF
jgi:hypothetical protein